MGQAKAIDAMSERRQRKAEAKAEADPKGKEGEEGSAKRPADFTIHRTLPRASPRFEFRQDFSWSVMIN